jgi:small basic protein (TIGR04137 family)
MSQHRSLKGASTIAAKRNVLKRFERVELLKKRKQWKDGQKVIGLPKTKPDVYHSGILIGAKRSRSRRFTTDLAAVFLDFARNDSGYKRLPCALIASSPLRVSDRAGIAMN